MKMSAEEGKEKANENGEIKRSKETQVVEAPAPFPLFPFGLFLLPLIVPVTFPADREKNRIGQARGPAPTEN
jgi:hypothetical protein